MVKKWIMIFGILLMVISQNDNGCSQYISYDDESTFLKLQKAIKSAKDKKQIPVKSCIRKLIEMDYQKSGTLLMENFEYSQYEAAAKDAIASMRRRIDKYVKVLNSKTQKVTKEKTIQMVSPAFQWAQSKSNIFLNVKYSAKLDSPGYLEVKNETVQFFSRGVMLQADVDYDDHILRFLLNITLLEDIESSNCTWNHEAVGRAYINLEKKVPAKWKRLTLSEERPPNIHMWWSMQEKFNLTEEKDQYSFYF